MLECSGHAFGAGTLGDRHVDGDPETFGVETFVVKAYACAVQLDAPGNVELVAGERDDADWDARGERLSG